MSVPATELLEPICASLVRPSEAAVVPPSTSWTWSFETPSPVLSVKTICPSSVEAVTPIVPALLIARSTSSMFWQFDRLTTALAPLPSVMRISPGVKPCPPLMSDRLTPWSTVLP